MSIDFEVGSYLDEIRIFQQPTLRKRKDCAVQTGAAASCHSSGRLFMPVEQRPKVLCSLALVGKP
jgi:hypothetical protein